ncbi:hypothetical protein NCAS_0E01240 [Naumovozyma castellii]|uniref:Ribosome biogenesis protein SLX9 n=1 Tax=Naumovozyma castellii TaxID=27288 RepID=G0VFC8_NAUCA|nr:hypothetical protein NCAS_0E01240 [Naumovozyma castellii CBS 4309]CCC70194.1 hypothetical protein NCAS_0E01240 [Naumovozyma castellii CBS 4309]
MVAKKRNTLRNKAASRAATNGSGSDDHDQSVFDLPPDPKAYLHQARETKKEKQMNKQQNFLERMKMKANGDGNLEGISKSSIRRRKRKMREDLKPKMYDLLTSLQQESDLRDHVLADDRKDDNNEDEMVVDSVTKITKSAAYSHITSGKPMEPGSVIMKKNQPNIRNQKGAKAISQKESARFNQVLTNQSFQQNPFGSLREIIKMQKK